MTSSSNLPAVPPTVAEKKAGYIDETELHPGLYGRPLELNRIFSLLVLLIDTLQRTAASQAQRLNFLSAWQKAYTDELNDIHPFLGGTSDGSQLTQVGVPQPQHLDLSLGFGSSQSATLARQDMDNLNTNITQQIQGNSQVVADDAKALQTSVNQSNDAVQAQSDMATSILQTLSTILTAIYSTTG